MRKWSWHNGRPRWGPSSWADDPMRIMVRNSPAHALGVISEREAAALRAWYGDASSNEDEAIALAVIRRAKVMNGWIECDCLADQYQPLLAPIRQERTFTLRRLSPKDKSSSIRGTAKPCALLPLSCRQGCHSGPHRPVLSHSPGAKIRSQLHRRAAGHSRPPRGCRGPRYCAFNRTE